MVMPVFESRVQNAVSVTGPSAFGRGRFALRRGKGDCRRHGESEQRQPAFRQHIPTS